MDDIIIVIKSKREQYYTTINLTALQDPALSWKAKSLHLYIRTRPEQRSLHIPDLVSMAIDGRDSVNTGLDELMTHKYLYRRTARTEVGLFHGYTYVSFEIPTECTEQEIEILINSSPREPKTRFPLPLIYSSSISESCNKCESNSKRANNICSSEQIYEQKIPVRIKSNPVKDYVYPDYEYPNYIEPFIVVWFKTIKAHTKNTKMFRNAVTRMKKAVNGILYFEIAEFRANFPDYRLTVSDFEISVDRFAIALSDNDMFPISKEYIKKINLGTFLYNPYGTSNVTKSYFLHYLKNEPVPITAHPEDDHPHLTGKLMSMYKKKVLGNAAVNIAREDVGRFIMASSRLYAFVEKNKDRIEPYFLTGDDALVEFLWKAVSSNVKSVHAITPGWFCSNTTFDRRLPAYLKKEHVLVDKEEDFSIYK